MTEPQKPRVTIKAERERPETPNAGGTYARVNGKLVPADASGQPLPEKPEAPADASAEDTSAPRRRGKPADADAPQE